jgi:hypothetical protein
LIGGQNAISKDEIKQIFSKETRFTAKALRDRLFHDFGPSHVSEVRDAAPYLITVMGKFLELRPIVERYLSQD